MVAIAGLGCGRSGQMHARNVARHPRTTHASVFDGHVPAAQKMADELGARVAASPQDVFADPAVDAVIIASPTDTHVDLLTMGVAAGKPILCEKPIDLSLARVEECAKAIAGTKVPIFLGFVRRFDPSHAAVAKAVREGTIGELSQVIVTSRDPGLAPESYLQVSGGIFRDMTIHDFDMARFILGEDVSEVVAVGSRLVDPTMMERLGDYDTISVLMTTASGRQAIINNSRRAVYGYDQRVEAFGSAGMAASQNCRPHAMTLSGEGYTEHAAPLLDFFIERYTHAFNAEIDAFADAVEGKAAPAVTFEDGRQAQRLAEAATLSARENRIVKLAELG